MKTTIQSIFILVLTVLVSTAVYAEDLTVAEVIEKRTELAGKPVSVTGTVIKVNNGIMRRNFIHVQDETAEGKNDRVIFTSTQTANVGDQVKATGIVKLDTDFGMGYFYDTLVENASFEPAK